MFLALAYLMPAYRDALVGMIYQAIQEAINQWGTEYNNADPEKKGQMIGDLIGQVLLLVLSSVSAAADIKNLIKSGGFLSACEGFVQKVSNIVKALKSFPEKVFQFFKENDR